jgi:hypothetical protein
MSGMTASRTHDRIHALLRGTAILAGSGMILLVLGFFAQASWAIQLWPWIGADYYEDPQTSAIFLTSISLATAASLLWLGLSGEVGAAAGGALNLLLTFAGLAAFLIHTSAQQGGTYPLVGSVVCGVVVVLLSATFLLALRYPIRDQRPMPLLVRCSFAAFSLVLLLVGSALLLDAPDIYPWTIGSATATLYGWIFVGAALYFLYGALRPRWGNAAGQLLGFLAYDLVLLPPFLGHFASVDPELRRSLTVYTAVLVYSAALACYYLFIDRATRLWPRRQLRAT